MGKNNKEEKKDPIMPLLNKLAVGESHTYPCTRTHVVRSTMNQVQLVTGKVFKTRLERPNLIITRVK